jgi:Rps23 Pro-64 3,4-dihydroxylase Tpa1-like proline 4-hydroxylase
MSLVVSSSPSAHFFFDREALRALAAERRLAYRDARPYPHAVFDGFLGEELACSLARAFPAPNHRGWIRRDYPEQSGRMGQLQRSNFDGIDSSLRQLLAELSGMAFLDFLGVLTGIDGLIPDPHFRGAGPSLTLPGGRLALHADFNRDRTRHLARAVTVLYYLGADWDDSWGGALELWNEELTQCEARYAPVLDRLVVMAHGDRFWHGHPAPLACPADRYRASVAAYYYAASPSIEDTEAHGAVWA